MECQRYRILVILGLYKVNGTICFLIQIDLGKANITVGIDSGLLIDFTQPFNEGILT